jgi:hypothetical protein
LNLAVPMKTNAFLLSALAICLCLAACGGDEPISWARSDRKPVKGSPELAQQFQADVIFCKGEVATSAAAAKTYKACMVARGYIEKK